MKIGPYVFCVAVGWLVPMAPAQAQNGVFGATRSNPDGFDLLTLQMGISEAFDSDVAPGASAPGGNPIGGHSNILTTDMDYSVRSGRARLFAGGTGSYRYSYQVEQGRPGPASGRTGVEIGMSRAGVLSLSQTLSYSPSYLYELLPGEIPADTDVPLPPSNPVYRIDATESLSHRTQLRLTTGRGLGWGLSTTANYRRADFQADELRPRDRESYDIGTRATFRPSRRRGVFFGYRYRGGRYGGASGRTSGSEIPLGFEFTPALTRTHRVSIRVEITPTIVDTIVPLEAEAEGDARSERRRQFPVQGSVGLDYPFHSKWRLSTEYRRGVNFLGVLSEPVVTDSGRLYVSGLMSRRVDVAIQARYAAATTVESSGSGRVRTASGDARLRFALTRSLAVFGEYLYYYYEDFGGQRRLAPDLSAQHHQHSVRLGLMLFTQPFNN